MTDGAQRKVHVTGTVGFIGFHLARLLLTEGFIVRGYDGKTDYYDVNLKRRRLAMLLQTPAFSATEGLLEDQHHLDLTASAFQLEIIVHLAAQAGVRHSLKNPNAYIDANLIGTFNVMEAAKGLTLKHLIMASTPSVYGANDKIPFIETENKDAQLTIYAATKKTNESMAHTYAHLWRLSATVFRFFTIYGTWGRPDLTLYKFVDAILEDRPIDIYVYGDMYPHFTFVDDLVRGILLLIDMVPVRPAAKNDIDQRDSLSPLASFRIVNIGNPRKYDCLILLMPSSIASAKGNS